ncbi:MAG: hypothetical protein ACI8PD_002031 [Nitrospinales bacterium]|jgi:hypothetical protein
MSQKRGRDDRIAMEQGRGGTTDRRSREEGVARPRRRKTSQVFETWQVCTEGKSLRGLRGTGD